MESGREIQRDEIDFIKRNVRQERDVGGAERGGGARLKSLLDVVANNRFDKRPNRRSVGHKSKGHAGEDKASSLKTKCHSF